VSELHVLRVFTAPDGGFGNPLGVFLDGPSIAPERRQAVATDLGFPETVYVDSVADGAATIRIFTPTRELTFAGHPTVGSAWLIRQAGHSLQQLRVPAGDVDTWQERDLSWIRGRAAWGHRIELRQYAMPEEVSALEGSPDGADSVYVWAWIDEGSGTIRARYFAQAVGIVEDEATGLAAVNMGEALARPLLIHQGRGSELFVRPGPDGTAEVGGRVVVDEVREYA
jgi:predicted PhzF superfamily epimerase YddE/YHI9